MPATHDCPSAASVTIVASVRTSAPNPRICPRFTIASCSRASATSRRDGDVERLTLWGLSPGSRFSTPSYTARMGHWSESLVDEVAHEVAQRGGGSPDRRMLTDMLARVGRELEVLSGRSFHPLRRTTSIFEPNGLPFVDIPDMQVGSMDPVAGAWAIPDPVNRQMAAVLQVASLANPAPTAAPAAEALWIAGQLLAEASRTGRLSGDYVLYWLGAVDHEQRMELMRRVMDPAVRFSVPILGVSAGGWWIQVARRLIWVTSETEDEGRLIELLLDNTMTGGEVAPLAAVEPILIAAPMTRQPADWAFTARIWTEGVRRPMDRPWSKIATAIHGHGIPTITLDPVSTPFEIACQVVLEGLLARLHRKRRASTGERCRDGVPAAGRAHSACYPCSEQRVCSRDAARTTDPPRIRPG